MRTGRKPPEAQNLHTNSTLTEQIPLGILTNSTLTAEQIPLGVFSRSAPTAPKIH